MTIVLVTLLAGLVLAAVVIGARLADADSWRSSLSEQRREAVRDLVGSLPEPASGLFVATLDRDALLTLLSSLKE